MPPPPFDFSRDQGYAFGASWITGGAVSGCATGSTVAGASVVVSVGFSLLWALCAAENFSKDDIKNAFLCKRQ
ncbi:MAG: hypothetical protein OEM91_05445 [Hyphomicrobiales bacterium]|nr:hypothetical protein [Hyphomicrobiales bacterium]